MKESIISGCSNFRSIAKSTFSCFGCLRKPMYFSDENGWLSDSEVQWIFRKYSSSDGIMKPTQFCRFLSEVQLEPNVSEEVAMVVMGNYGEQHSFTNQGFLSYLFDPSRNYAIRSEKQDDMNLPLSCYFIFTGHNSYLSGNQIIGCSNVKAIADSLLKGVRVVELDLWPSCGENIHVKHGKTLVFPVSFNECLKTIMKNAFKVSPYPVVVTLEDHLTPSLRVKAAKMIKDTFGDHLYCPNPSKVMKQYPSPEELKNKILISTKPLSTAHYSGQLKDRQGHRKMQNAAVSSSSDDEELDDSYGTDVDEEDYHDTQEYDKIISISGGRVKGKSLVDALNVEESVKRVSISEPVLSKIVESYPSHVIQFTQNNFLRVYPKGMRIDSSNYNPIKAWSYGAQMVAMNMQGYGKYLWVTQGFFRANGGCGYVKKPDYLIHGDPKISEDIFKMEKKTLPVKTMLEVAVCMGLGWRVELGKCKFDIFSAPDFYARVGIAGVKADRTMKRTSTVSNKWNPSWNENFKFAVRVPELAVLRIEIYDSDPAKQDEFAGQICFPVNELRAGYRVAVLCDENGEEWTRVKILLKISFQKII